MEGAPRIMSRMARLVEMSRMKRTHGGTHKGIPVLQPVEPGLHISCASAAMPPTARAPVRQKKRASCAGQEVGIEHQQGHILGASLLLLFAASNMLAMVNIDFSASPSNMFMMLEPWRMRPWPWA